MKNHSVEHCLKSPKKSVSKVLCVRFCAVFIYNCLRAKFLLNYYRVASSQGLCKID